MPQSFRPPAVPLVTIDPFFSIWSCADRLHDDATRHWTLVHHGLVGLVRIDGQVFRFMGSTNNGPHWRNSLQPSGLRQTGVTVLPTRTIYVFEDAGVELTATFVSPLLPDDLDLLSRPFSYLSFSVRSADGRDHGVSLYIEASPEIACGDRDTSMVWEISSLSNGWGDLRTGTWEQNVLGHRGDLTTIDWGYLHLIGDAMEHAFGAPEKMRAAFSAGESISEYTPELERKGLSLNDGAPSPAMTWDLSPIGGARNESSQIVAILGYDEIASIDYFGTHQPAYCFRNGASFSDLADRAIREWDDIERRCVEFDERLRDDARSSGGREFADLVGLAYRQSVAAHKLIADNDGNPVFLSKECTSNGSVGTVDVSYPSVPLFLLEAPELVAGMLRPVFRFAESDVWPEPYAPHDVGTYPRATGQTYGVSIDTIDFSRQMPVEECGNMLIMTAAYTAASGSTELAKAHWSTLTQWADYLVEHGLDPENQLCTDDFAGHLARNTNLSIKAIVGIAAYSRLCETTGAGGETYLETARKYARSWVDMAREGDHCKLTFDGNGTWSLKYNLIWDRLFGFGLFPADVARDEVEFYLGQADTYGVPMDSRARFTKTDWLIWAGCLAESQSTRDRFVKMVRRFADETPDRTPFCDWYDTHDAREQSFHNRSVIGGIFMPILIDKGLAGRLGTNAG